MNKKTIAIDLNEVIRDFRMSFFKGYAKYLSDNDLTLDEEYPYGEFLDIDKSFPFYDEDKRIDKNARETFQYEDYVYELYARADTMSKNLNVHLQDWYYNVLCDYESEENPDLMIVSTMECGLSIPCTLNFLSRVSIKAREYYFPIDSATIWDKCDILITANPKLIGLCPEGKTVIKINTIYNKDVETELTFDSLDDLINDPRKVVNCILEGNPVEPSQKQEENEE